MARAGPSRPQALLVKLVERWIPRTTTARIGALLFVTLLIGSALLLALLERTTESQLETEAKSRITAISVATADSWRLHGAKSAFKIIEGELVVPGPLVVLLAGPGGGRLIGNLARWPAGVPADGRYYRLSTMQGGNNDDPFIVMARRLPDGHRLLVGRSLAAEVQLQRTLNSTLLASLPLAMLLSFLTSRLITRVVSGRARGLVDVVGEVTAGKLNARVAVPDGPPGDDFDSMGQAFNLMLARIEGLIDELRTVTDGLAHDLRSPLTRLKARIDRLSHNSGPGATIDAADLTLVAAEANALLAMLDNSLEISRAEAGIGRDSFIAVDLGALVADLADMYEPLAEDAGVTLKLADALPVMARAHRQLLSRAMANLIDNALRYAAEGKIIELGAQATPGGALLWVADHGPGIPARSRAEALRRFGRLDAARGQGGAGLGLSLAAAVARLHGGTIALSDNRPGLKVLLDLPTAP